MRFRNGQQIFAWRSSAAGEPRNAYSNSGSVKPGTLGGHDWVSFCRASIPALDRTNGLPSLKSARRARSRKIAPFRLDRDIVEDQITFSARAVSFLNRLGIAFA